MSSGRINNGKCKLYDVKNVFIKLLCVDPLIKFVECSYSAKYKSGVDRFNFSWGSRSFVNSIYFVLSDNSVLSITRSILF